MEGDVYVACFMSMTCYVKNVIYFAKNLDEGILMIGVQNTDYYNNTLSVNVKWQ